MATRKLQAILDVDASGAVRGLDQAAKAAGKTADALDKVGGAASNAGAKAGASGDAVSRSHSAWERMSTVAAKNRTEWDLVSSSATRTGLAVGGMVALTTNAAIDWESAWAGVNKTVDGTASQMGVLEDGLRGLTKVLPSSHEEIAGVAEAAGQLGVARGDIVDFTHTMIDLGNTTNLSAETAATAIAQFTNVMGTSRDKVSNLGSALVDLGNKGASTEADIMSMATRLSGASAMIGASEQDTLALAAAMANLGIESDLGGGAMSRTMQRINTAVKSGSAEMEGFASISGMTAQQFSDLWSRSPVEAIDAFVQGLGRVRDTGGDVAGALDQVGINGTMDVGVLSRLAGAGDGLTESLKISNSAWEQNSALQAEASKRYETTASKLKIAQNSIRDAAIDAGAVFGPMLAQAAGAVASVADAFAKLPGPVQSAISGFGAVAGAGALAVGVGGKLVGSFLDVRESLSRLSAESPRAAAGLDRVSRSGKALGKALAVITAANVVSDLAGFGDLVPEMRLNEFTGELLTAGDAVAAFNARANELSNIGWGEPDSAVRSFGDALHYTFDASYMDGGANRLGKLFSLFGVENHSDIEIASKRLSDLDSVLAQLATGGNADRAAELFDQFAAEAEASGYSVDQLREVLPQYGEAVAAAGNQALLASDDVAQVTDELDTNADGFVSAAEDAQAFEDALQGVGDAIAMLGGGFRAEQAALRQYTEAQTAAKDAVKASAEEQDAALSDLAESALAYASAQVEMGRGSETVVGGVESAREAFIRQAEAMGKSREYAEQLADAYGLLPETVQTMIDAVGVTESTAEVLDLNDSIRLLSGKTVKVSEAGASAAKGRVIELDGAIFGLPGKTVKVTEVGATAAGDRVVKFGDRIFALKGKTVAVGVSGADTARDKVNGLISVVSRLTGKTVRIRYVTEYSSTGRRPTSGGTMKASGGLITGPGTTTSDSIPAWLSNMEYVQPAKATAYYGVDFMESIRRLQFPRPGFADGGLAATRATYVAPSLSRSPVSVGAAAVAVDPRPIAAAVDAAMSGWQPMVSIDGQTIHGVMRRVNRQTVRAGGGGI